MRKSPSAMWRIRARTAAKCFTTQSFSIQWMPMAKISLIQRPSRCGSPMPAMPRCTAHWALRMRASRVPKERPRTTVQLHQTKCAHPRLNLQPYKRRHVNRIAARFLAGGTTAQRGVAHVRCAQTTPPKRFTDGTLISAMTHIHRFVHSDADRKILRESKGIGTERTRDAIIERLKQRRYVVREKNGALRPTERGIELIRKCPRALSDPVTTAKWETALGLIEQGKMAPQSFDTMIRTMTAQVVEAIKGVQFDLNRFGVKPSKDTR